MEDKALDDLVEISRFYGTGKDYVIAGGGNTSWKDGDRLWIKASGTSLETIGRDGFAVMSRAKLREMAEKKYSDDPFERERQVKADLHACSADPSSPLRPSVETNLHEIIEYSYVVHLHPALVGGLLCSLDSRRVTAELFPDALYIEYTDPGYTLFRKVKDEIEKYREARGHEPQVIFMENHGVFVSAGTTGEIRQIYDRIFSGIRARLGPADETEELAVPEGAAQFMPVIRMLVSDVGHKTVSARNNTLISRFSQSSSSFSKVSAPFTPDIIVYCKSSYLYIDENGSPEKIIGAIESGIQRFRSENGYFPVIVVVKGYGLFGIGDNWQMADTALDIFEDLMKISRYTESFGGPRFMNDRQIEFIDTWEVENYRRNVASGKKHSGRVEGITAIVTGGAMGFGAGIALSLIDEGANVVIADISREEGEKLTGQLNGPGRKNRAVFIESDITVPVSVKQLVDKTVMEFGGLDLMVSNAGILYAGSLDEMDEEVFERVTRVNYTGYFHCAKYASAVMKLQNRFSKARFFDIIQINSKSGLKGSNRNFAYAGGKFGGIGLTQSFALELMQFNIKVNSICPGNFFEGPLWSDPENGLFVQYLRTGKVPGAKTVDDVKRHYEKQVPAGRGCRVEDVMKAIYYVIGQEYETGQAVPVTGGQNMLH
ncbi:MAG: SDR family NAD(P)-dependent oxidoreductase [Marinilabiliales bacterium]|nr:MAG: SDR family NAD(P)-dependent oxidoreductase [Marinilabiliales bacterium]